MGERCDKAKLDSVIERSCLLLPFLGVRFLSAAILISVVTSSRLKIERRASEKNYNSKHCALNW